MFPSLQQSCLVCARSKDRVDFAMERFAPSNNDSGWYLGCTDTDHDHNNPDNLRRISLYELACDVPASVPFFALPKRSVVEVAADTFSFIYEGRRVFPKRDSFLHQYFQNLMKRRSEER
jgi:hypothetical protein